MNLQNVLARRYEIEKEEQERTELAAEAMKDINDIVDAIDPICCLKIAERTHFKISFNTESEYDPIWMVTIEEDKTGYLIERFLFRLESNGTENWPSDKKEDWEKSFINFIAEKVPSHFLQQAIEKMQKKEKKHDTP